MNHRTAMLAPSLVCIVCLLAFSLVLAAPLAAQQNPAVAPTPARDNRTELRMRDYLVLPPTAKDEKAQKNRDESDTSQLRPALTTLNGLITSFVTNPLFKKDTSVDYTLVARARRDLDGIIDYSEKIRKSAEKMTKTVSKPD